MVTCHVCLVGKPSTDFYRDSTKARGHATRCKVCTQKRDTARREHNRAAVLAYLVEHPCVDCGEGDPRVLEFDHQGDKSANVSDMIQKGSLKTLLAEIAKCEVRCANCHRRKTAIDFNHYKHRMHVALCTFNS